MNVIQYILGLVCFTQTNSRTSDHNQSVFLVGNIQSYCDMQCGANPHTLCPQVRLLRLHLTHLMHSTMYPRAVQRPIAVYYQIAIVSAKCISRSGDQRSQRSAQSCCHQIQCGEYA